MIAFFGVSMLMFNACKKDMNSNPVNNTEDVYWTAEDLKIQNTILNFQNKIKNNTYKSGEEMSQDSAIWYMEALMNFNYSTPDSSFVNLTVDTTFEFEIIVNNDMVSYDDITDAAFAMEDHILNFLDQMSNEIKFIIAADVSIIDNGFKDGTRTVTIITAYGSEYIDNPGCYTPFGEDDYWKYGLGYVNQGGYCDGPNQGQNVGSDAAEEIQYKINHPNATNIYPHAYYTDVVTVGDNWWDGYPDYEYNISDYLNQDDDISGDGFLDYLTLKVDWYYGCLSPEEMNFYLQGNLDIIEAERQKLIVNTGLSYKFMYTDLKGMYFYGPTVISGITTYGIRHYGSPIE